MHKGKFVLGLILMLGGIFAGWIAFNNNSLSNTVWNFCAKGADFNQDTSGPCFRTYGEYFYGWIGAIIGIYLMSSSRGHYWGMRNTRYL